MQNNFAHFSLTELFNRFSARKVNEVMRSIIYGGKYENFKNNVGMFGSFNNRHRFGFLC